MSLQALLWMATLLMAPTKAPLLWALAKAALTAPKKGPLIMVLTKAALMIALIEARLLILLTRATLHSFDRVGTCTRREYWTIPHAFVDKSVKWDLHKNVLFVVGCLILSQGQGGVPIGGRLSAQFADLWCVWREMVCLGK